MKIVADRDIFQVEEFFSPLGELVLMPGREICAEHVKDAQALLVRTVTSVNNALVHGSSLRFVGSAASGTDHVDLDCLDSNGIHFSHAPGCNADAVVDYVFAALAWLCRHNGENWREKSVGIIGAGNVGSRLAQKMLTLGMHVRIHDPLLADTHSLAGCFDTLENVLNSDIASLHVPLTRTGQFPTWHMMDREKLSALRAGAIFINAARGEVVDNSALHDLLFVREDLRVVLDVWEGEPAINHALLSKIAIATPHIAGYSRNGKLNATRVVHQALCEFINRDIPAENMKASAGTLRSVAGMNEADALNAAILQAYAINQDFLEIERRDVAAHFDSRRNGYAFRHEFSDFIFPAKDLQQSLVTDLCTLGFRKA